MKCSFALAGAQLLLFVIIAGGQPNDTETERVNEVEDPRRSENRRENPNIQAETDDASTKSWTCPRGEYKSYLKCLQRRRRHDTPSTVHSRPSATGAGNGGSCVQECERESCRYVRSHTCVEVCHERCFKKTKEVHHTITEYEDTCRSAEGCDRTRYGGSGSREPLATNLTTSVDIRNYLNNTNVIVTSGGRHDDRGHRNDDSDRDNDRDAIDRDKGHDRDGCKHDRDGSRHDSGSQGNSNGSGHVGEGEPGVNRARQFWYPAPSLALVPQIQMVPQLTFGLGVGLGVGPIGGGCVYATAWPCFQQQPTPQQVAVCSPGLC